MKVTYHLSTRECISWHSSKWRKEQPFLITHHVRMITKNESSTHLLHEHKWMYKFTQQQVKKSNHSFLITQIVLECEPNIKVTYFLSTSECMSSRSSKWRKEQSFILNHASCVRMWTKYESNLLPEHKWMHEFTQQEVEKRAIIHSWSHILC